MQISPALVSEYFGARGAPETKTLGVLGGITPKVLSRHEKAYAAKVPGKPLMALNRGRPIGFYTFTGLLLTDEALAFKTVRDFAFSSIWWFKGRKEVMPLREVRSFQIGRHDRCLGTNYIGHQLLVNGEVMGLVRMGGGITFDEKPLRAINGFAQFLFEKGVADAAPKEYAWQ